MSSEQQQVQQEQQEPDAVMCGYGECSQDPVTTLEVDGEEKPVCANHIDAVVDQMKDETDDPGRYPVLSNSDDQAAWINTDKNGQPYLSVKVGDGEYVNLFAQTDLMQDMLNRQHEIQKQSNGGGEK